MEFETILLISYIIGFVLALAFSVTAWATRDRDMWNNSLYVWIAMILCGWVLGVVALAVIIIYVCSYIVEQRFKG